MQSHYEVHFARSNRADLVSAARANVTRHETYEAALEESRLVVPPRPDLVTLVCEVRTFRPRGRW
jgi:hypothetical protein